MANLEISIGADSSELQSELHKVERQLQTLERRQEVRVRAGLDTGDLNRRITETRANLDRLRTSMNSMASSAGSAQRPIANAGNTLTNFSRIAQDAPFGIMGIGNNLTATAEAFASLSQQAGGSGNALRAVATSMMGTGGILLAVSLVTTALTVMSQQGLTVGDVFDKLTGNFDKYRNSLQDVNKEAAKNSAQEIQSVRNYVAVAKDRNVADNLRLIAVQKLQDEYPGYFGNLSKEKILNGDVKTAVDDVTKAILAKARAQAASAKLGELAAQEFELTEKQAKQQELVNKAIIKKASLEKKLASEQFNEQTFKSLQQITRALETYNDDLADTKKELSGITAEMNKLSKASETEFKKGIGTEASKTKTPKIKIDRPDIEMVDALKTQGAPTFFKDLKENMFQGLLDKTKSDKESILTDLQQEGIDLRRKYGEFLRPVFDEIVKFNEEMNSLFQSSIGDTFGGIGESIGQALASGGNVLESVGMSIVSSMGAVLSAIGDKLIALGAASLLASTVFTTFGTALGVGAALAAIAGGVALKAGGSLLSGMSQGMSGSGGGSSVSAGNSVSSPTSSTNFASSGGGFQNVVFEISGQSLVGVLSNTLNKNVKLGGTPAI